MLQGLEYYEARFTFADRVKKEASFCTFSHSKFKITVNKKIPYKKIY
jgi:hypothetical protein